MSYSKIAFEDENGDPFVRCERCGEYEDECICPDVATEGHVFYPGDETPLAQAGDSSVTCTSPHTLDGVEQ